MEQTISISAYFSTGSRRPAPGTAQVGIAASGADQMLTITFPGQFRVVLAARRLRAAAAEARKAFSGAGRQEYGEEIPAHAARRPARPMPCRLAVWFSVSSGFEMLTVEHSAWGQISLPYAQVERLMRGFRQGFA